MRDDETHKKRERGVAVIEHGESEIMSMNHDVEQLIEEEQNLYNYAYSLSNLAMFFDFKF
jgi:hypothetical protein